MSKVVWSYSSLSTFKSCPKKYYHLKVLKDYKDEGSEATLYGELVHKAAENFIKDGTEIPEQFKYLRKPLEVLAALPGDKYCELKLGVAKTSDSFQPRKFFDKDVWWRGIADLVIIAGDRAWSVDYKGLPVDTLVSTPYGFTRMGDISLGDVVHGSDGNAYPVVCKSPVKLKPCFKVSFDDKTSVVCDDEHLWSLVDGSVVPVKELVPKKSKIRVAAPVEMDEQELIVDPYVLGLWLADGVHSDGKITNVDAFVWEEVGRRGYSVSAPHGKYRTKADTRVLYGLRSKLKALGVLGRKHIPAHYLTASIQQRLDLLRGLMDGDGSVNPQRKQVVFQNVDKSLSDQVKILVESLGCRVSQGANKYYGFGVSGVAYPLSWRPRHFVPFLLPRKANAVKPEWGHGDSWYRRVVSVEAVEPTETQCIAVESPDNTYLCTEHRIVTHNTSKNARYADTKQLDAVAAAIFTHFPQVKVIKSALLFVVSGDLIPKTHYAEDKEKYFGSFSFDLSRLERAQDTGVWNANPSGLCKKYCPVLSCPHNGRSS